ARPALRSFWAGLSGRRRRLTREERAVAILPAPITVEIPGKAVDPPKKSGQRLAGARWRRNQRILTAGDRRPTGGLTRRRRLKRGFKPGTNLGAERCEGVGGQASDIT